jgi:hypothetical protein
MAAKAEVRLPFPEQAFVQPARLFPKGRNMKELFLCRPEPGTGILNG